MPDSPHNRFRDPARWATRQEVLRLLGDWPAKDGPSHLLVALVTHSRPMTAVHVRVLRQAQQQNPQDFWLNFFLGAALRTHRGEEREDAAGFFRAAIAIRPASPAYVQLGITLSERGRRADAEAVFRKAVELFPRGPIPRTCLANALRDQGRTQQALREYRIAIELEPTRPQPHFQVGILQEQVGRLDEAIREYRRAIELDASYFQPYLSLASALRKRDQREEAVPLYHKAAELAPRHPSPYLGLGETLLEMGDLRGAAQAFTRAGELGAEDAREQRRRCERLQALLQRLPGVLDGKDRPANARERLAFADLCRLPFQQRYAAATRLCAEAFAQRPKLAENLKADHRYDAACTAALAGCGQGKDAAGLDETGKARLRRQALDWLKADLALYTRQDAEEADFVQRRLRSWRQDPDLAGVRAAAALARLPEAERRAWQALWEAVDRLLDKVGRK